MEVCIYKPVDLVPCISQFQVTESQGNPPSSIQKGGSREKRTPTLARLLPFPFCLSGRLQCCISASMGAEATPQPHPGPIPVGPRWHLPAATLLALLPCPGPSGQRSKASGDLGLLRRKMGKGQLYAYPHCLFLLSLSAPGAPGLGPGRLLGLEEVG